MKRIFLSIFLAGALLLGSQWSGAQAATFAFFERSTGDVLAEMDLSGSAPFTRTSIDDFRFTAAGSAIFGLAEGSLAFPFTRALNGRPITDQREADGGLSTGEIGFAEFQTDFTDMGVGGIGGDRVVLFFSSNISSADTLTLNVDSTQVRISVKGDWEKAGLTSVPLPAGLPLLGAALGSLAFMRRKKTQQVRL